MRTAPGGLGSSSSEVSSTSPARPRPSGGSARKERRKVEILVLDLRELTFLDSTGLRLITSAAGRASLGGWRLVLVRGPEPVQRVFRITRLDGELEFVHDPAELS
jgi:anti-anti-sigma factor